MGCRSYVELQSGLVGTSGAGVQPAMLEPQFTQTARSRNPIAGSELLQHIKKCCSGYFGA